MRTHTRLRAAVAIVGALALTIASFFPVSVFRVGAQTQSPATQTVFRTFAPYWQVNGGYSSTLIIRNTDHELAATLTPVIFTSDSKQSRLAPVVVPPDSVLSLSLAGALKEAGISANWGALALEQSQAPPVTLLGEVRIENAEHSLIFNLPLHAGYVGGESKTLRASWWLPDEETKGTIVLLNTSNKELVVHPVLRASWIEQSAADISLKAHEIRVVDLADLLRENGLRDASTGSLSLVYEGPTNALLPSLLLLNEKTGFSLTGKFFPRQSSAPGQQTVWHFPAVFVNSADPGMGFKQNLKFTPWALLANHTTETMPLDLTAHFEIAGTGGLQSATLALPPLGGLETRLVDLSEFITKELMGKDAHFFSLTLTHPGATGDLGVQIISLDKSGNFVFPAEGSTEVARSFNAVSWDISGNQRSLVELQNVTENSVEARVTLTYTASGGNTPGSYQLPAVLLPPHATRFVNLKEILSAGQPDQEGNVVPSDVTFGTARVDVTGEASGNALVVAGAVFDPILGTCEGGSFCSNPPILVLIDGFETIRWEFFILLGATIIACEIGCDETIPPEVTLSCTSPVTRGQSSACTITVAGAPSGASISFSGWKFEGGGATVTRTTNQASGSWSGVMITSGTVSVTVTINGTQFPASAAITVNNRSGFAFTAVSATKVQNGFNDQAGCSINVPSPPVPNMELGEFCLQQAWSFNFTTINDNGPNHLFCYVTSVSPTFTDPQGKTVNTAFSYVISPDLENNAGAFFMAQCGSYSAQTNTGFISGVQLLANTIDHESNSQRNNHFSNYVQAQNDLANNLGVVAEAQTGPPSMTLDQFTDKVNIALSGKKDTIRAAAKVEPCGVSDVRRDNACMFRGCINFPDANGNFFSCQASPPPCQP